MKKKCLEHQTFCRWFVCLIDPASQRIILKIVGFIMSLQTFFGAVCSGDFLTNERKKRKLISFKMSAHINMSERGHGVKQDKKRATTAIFSTFLADLLPVQKKVLCYPNRWCRRARKTRCWWAQKLTLIRTENCSDLLWEKIVLVIEKNFWNSRLKAENLQNFWDH